MDKRKRVIAVLAAILAGIMLLTTLLGLFASVASAAPSSDSILDQIDKLKDEQKEIDKELDKLEDGLKEVNDDIRDMMDRKDAIDQQISLLTIQVKNVSAQVSAYNLMIADKQDELEKAEEKLAELNRKYKDRIRAMEEQGVLSYLAVVFNASDFVDLLDRMNMMVEIANADRKRLKDLKEAAAEVSEARKALTEEKKSVESVKFALEAAETAMAAKRAEADKLLQDLVAKGADYEELIDRSEQLQEELMDELGKMEDEYDKAKYEEWLATSVPPTTTHPAEDPGNTVDGKVWYVPTKNFKITSKFGMRWHPIHDKYMMHNGIDMGAKSGTPIYATRSGIVTVASYQKGGAGYYVKINHNDGYSSIYMHMTHYIVKKGQYVSAGEIIGYVGSTGGSTGPHLHFGIAYNGKYVDPLKYINV